jgi:glycosyltransferase involved in cell wall biosynthesis
VVDDGSTDPSWDVIRGRGVRAYQRPNGGQLNACIYGLDQTTAPFVLFLDADDELRPSSLERILGALDPSVSKLQYPLIKIDEQGQVIGAASPDLSDFRGSDGVLAKISRSGVYATPPTSGNVFRRDVCEVLRSVDYSRILDGVILFYAPFVGDIVSLSEPLGHYRIQARNMSGVGASLSVERLQKDLDAYFKVQSHLRRLLRAQYPDFRICELERTIYAAEKRLFISVFSETGTSVTAARDAVLALDQLDATFVRSLALAVLYSLLPVTPKALARRLVNLRANPRRGAVFARSGCRTGATSA